MHCKKGTDILLISFEEKIINISNHDLIINESSLKNYILKDFPLSKRAIGLLNSLSIPHNVILIDSDESFEKITDKSSYNTFPQIFLDNKIFGGYDELYNKQNWITIVYLSSLNFFNIHD